VKNKFFEKREKDKRIIELWYNNNTYDQIAKEVHASPNYISAVTKKEIIRVEKEEREKENARALMLFSQGKSALEVCMKLAISAEEASSLHNDYLELTNRSKLVKMNEELGGTSLG
jgi:predicted Zn-dependent peptidase